MRRRPRPRATPRRPPTRGPGAGSDGRGIAPCSIARRRPKPGSSPESSLPGEERRVRRHADALPAAPAAPPQGSIDGPPLQSAFQGAEGAVLQRLDSTDTLAQDRGHLRGGQILEEAEDQNLLLLVGQVADGGVQILVRE